MKVFAEESFDHGEQMGSETEHKAERETSLFVSLLFCIFIERKWIKGERKWESERER